MVLFARQSGSNCPNCQILLDNWNHLVGQLEPLCRRNKTTACCIPLMSGDKFVPTVCPITPIFLDHFYLFVSKIFWYAWTNILIKVKWSWHWHWKNQRIWKLKKKKVRNQFFRWFYHSDLLYIRNINIYVIPNTSKTPLKSELALTFSLMTIGFLCLHTDKPWAFSLTHLLVAYGGCPTRRWW